MADVKILQNNKIQVGLWWCSDGHNQEVVSISTDGKTCEIKETWVSEDTWEEREEIATYDIKEENGAEYAASQKYPEYRMFANGAYNYPYDLWGDEGIDGACYPEEDEEEEDEEYTPSSTFGDYSPSNPWDAPGMSISDFI